MNSLKLILSQSRYFGPAWVFASLNIWFGTWAIYIPWVKDRLGIDKASLGIALFFLAFGVFTIFPLAARIINAMGVGKATWTGVLLCSVTALFPLIAPSYELLIVSLFLFGACNGFLDISMNSLVTEIEVRDGSFFMSASHGFFSLGGVLAGLTSFAIPIIDNPPLHMLGVVVLVLLINLLFFKHYYRLRARPIEKKTFSIKLFKPLFLLGIISFITMGAEGAIVDWSGLFLKEVTLAPEFLIGSGFLGFSATMTLGRFLGDGISRRIGSHRIVLLGSSLAAVGFLAVLSASTAITITGFALTGLGLSVIVPELFRIGGKVPGIVTAQGIAFIAGSGYLGFLTAPPVLGYIAEEFSLVHSFGVLTIAILIVIISITYLIAKTPKKSRDA